MCIKLRKAVLFIVLTSISLSASAQLIKNFHTSAEQKDFTKWFDKQVGTRTLAIYNGVTYPLKIKSKNGHQFFKNSQWQLGDIKYASEWYFDVLLLFDIIDNKLIVKSQNGQASHGFALDMSNVEHFTFGKSSFIPITNKGSRQFYELLYKGNKVSLLVSHKKSLKLASSGYEISKSVSYFLASNSEIFNLRTKNSLKYFSADASNISKRITSKDAKFKLRKPELLIEFIKRFDEAL